MNYIYIQRSRSCNNMADMALYSAKESLMIERTVKSCSYMNFKSKELSWNY